jgi:hypothetical protein
MLTKYILVVPPNSTVYVVPRLSVKTKRTICELAGIALFIACLGFGACVAKGLMPPGPALTGTLICGVACALLWRKAGVI